MGCTTSHSIQPQNLGVQEDDAIPANVGSQQPALIAEVEPVSSVEALTANGFFGKKPLPPIKEKFASFTARPRSSYPQLRSPRKLPKLFGHNVSITSPFMGEDKIGVLTEQNENDLPDPLREDDLGKSRITLLQPEANDGASSMNNSLAIEAAQSNPDHEVEETLGPEVKEEEGASPDSQKEEAEIKIEANEAEESDDDNDVIQTPSRPHSTLPLNDEQQTVFGCAADSEDEQPKVATNIDRQRMCIDLDLIAGDNDQDDQSESEIDQDIPITNLRAISRSSSILQVTI